MVTPRSASGLTVMLAVPVALFAPFGSNVDEVTLPLVAIVPGALALTTHVIGADLPLPSVPIVQVTGPVLLQPGAAETKVPPPKLSVAETLVAASGPLFVTV